MYLLLFFFFFCMYTHPEMENTSEWYSDASEHDFSSSFDTSDTDIEFDNYHDITSSIMPYAFEPTIDSTSDYSLPSVPSVHMQYDDQNEDENWCRCGKCRFESWKLDQFCCKQLSIERGDEACLCNEGEFKNICLCRPYLDVILVGLSKTWGYCLEKNSKQQVVPLSCLWRVYLVDSWKTWTI